MMSGNDGVELNAADAAAFVYMGEEEEEAPFDVVRVRVDPSVTSIPAEEFNQRKKLVEVGLCEGLVEIGERSFSWCKHSIMKMNIPNSLRRINNWAFHTSLQSPIRLHDGIEIIGRGAFLGCIFTNFRVPPLITAIPKSMLKGCKTIFSIEFSEDATEVGDTAFERCYCLRNVAFPSNAVFGNNIFIGTEMQTHLTDLQLLFGESNALMIRELQHRFDILPVHRLVYYQSYNQGVLQILVAAINSWPGNKLDPTGNLQDCLGMIPLHILACSSTHNLGLYRVIVEKYPANLITEDRWGALPLLYAFWGAAPAEIIDFLLKSYQTLYPDYVFNWTMMVETMGRCNTPKERIESLLQVKQTIFTQQSIDWEYLLEKFAQPSFHSFPTQFQVRMRFLVMCGMSARVEALAFKVWCDYITNMIQTSNFEYNGDNLLILHRIQDKIAYFEDEFLRLKNITTILELVLWKLRMNMTVPQENATHCRKKIKTDASSMRRQCRITCGADGVIPHVLPYLFTATDKEFASYAESDSTVSSDEEFASDAESDDQSRDSM